MGPTPIGIIRIVIRTHTLSCPRIGIADSEGSILRRQSICPWESAEVTVERTVFLHNDDHMLDFVNSFRNRRRALGLRTHRNCQQQEPNRT